MLGNRCWGWKLGAAVALVVGAMAWSERRGEDINPAWWRCRLEPERFDGARLWFPTAQVISKRPDAFTVRYSDSEVDILGTAPPSEVISLVCTFRSDGTLTLVRADPIRFNGRVRFWVNLLSLAAFALAVVYFAFAFRIRWDRITLRRSDG